MEPALKQLVHTSNCWTLVFAIGKEHAAFESWRVQLDTNALSMLFVVVS